MRFIFNFIFFGLLYYIIFLAFPEAFQKLVSWVTTLFEFLRDIFMQLYHRLQDLMGRREGSTQAALLLIPIWIHSRTKKKK